MSTKTVRQAIISCLTTRVVGTGLYVNNLTGTNSVLGGKYLRPPSVTPFACVWTAQVDEVDGVPLTSNEQNATFMILAFPKVVNPTDPAARQNAAEDMLDDIRRALRADPRLGGTVILHSASGAPWEDEVDQTPKNPALAKCLVSVTAKWRE